MSKGKFVVLEGIDGCGKTTQLQALRKWLPMSGLLPLGAELVATREPGAAWLSPEDVPQDAGIAPADLWTDGGQCRDTGTHIYRVNHLI